jgi:hypothetical protein
MLSVQFVHKCLTHRQHCLLSINSHICKKICMFRKPPQNLKLANLVCIWHFAPECFPSTCGARFLPDPVLASIFLKSSSGKLLPCTSRSSALTVYKFHYWSYPYTYILSSLLCRSASGHPIIWTWRTRMCIYVLWLAPPRAPTLSSPQHNCLTRGFVLRHSTIYSYTIWLPRVKCFYKSYFSWLIWLKSINSFI